MLHFDKSGELKRRFLLTAVERNRNSQLRVRALQEIAASKDAEAFDRSIDIIGTWSRDERRDGAKVMFQALAEKRIGRRDQANAWIWRLAEYTRDVHEEYAVQRWPETKRLLGLLVNSSGGAHARNARRLVHASRKQDRRLSAALLAAAVAHTPEAEEVLRGARTRMARKPSALSRELLRNFPKGRRGRNRRRRKKAAEPGAGAQQAVVAGALTQAAESEAGDGAVAAPPESDQQRPARRRRSRGAARAGAEAAGDAAPADETAPQPADQDRESAAAADGDTPAAKPAARRRRAAKPAEPGAGDGGDGGDDDGGGDGDGDGDGAKPPEPKARAKTAAKPRGSGAGTRRRKPVGDGPDEKVMTEALRAHPDHDGPPLDATGREQLEDRVAATLSDAKSEEAA
jgi:hypothetical protein